MEIGDCVVSLRSVYDMDLECVLPNGSPGVVTRIEEDKIFVRFGRFRREVICYAGEIRLAIGGG